MKKCPNCGEDTVPLKWMLFEKANGQKGRCYICDHCGVKIRKKSYLGYILDFNFEMIVVVMLGLYLLTKSSLISFWLSPVLLIIAIMASNLFASLHIADEGYCRGDMTKTGAFFGLIIMFAIIALMIDVFIIKPFF
ncbi:MAG: hypothetical protein AB7D20_09855 [Sulfuricurvum sp.]|uniref:hypothetical protein n=1 Tax=Sulfuricurvum sp. TaxID=2025608 RepID=UPI003D0E12A3